MNHVVLAGDTTSATVVFTGLIGAAIGAIASLAVMYFTPIAQRRDRYDGVILARRMQSYDRLFNLLKPTSRHYERLGQLINQPELAERLTHWYYRDGMYLTQASYDLFFQFRDDLEDNNYANSEAVDKASELRKQLARDVNSRRRPMLRERDTARYPHRRAARTSPRP